MAYVMTIEVKSLDAFFQTLDQDNVTILDAPFWKRPKPEPLPRVRFNKKPSKRKGEVNSPTLILQHMQNCSDMTYSSRIMKDILVQHDFSESTFTSSINSLVRAGMVERVANGWRLTARGREWPDIPVPWSPPPKKKEEGNAQEEELM